MKDKKHIDRIFQEKFKNFEVAPDAAVWDTIHNTLHKDKRKPRVLPLWWFAAGTAAVLIMFFEVGNLFNNDRLRSGPQLQTVDTENTGNPFKATPSLKAEDTKDYPLKDEDVSKIANTEPPKEENNPTHQAGRNGSLNDPTDTQIERENVLAKQTSPSYSDEGIKIDHKDGLNSDPLEETIVKNSSNLPGLFPKKNNGPEHLQAQKFLEKESGKIIAPTNPIQKPTENENLVLLDVADESIEEAIAKANLTHEKEKEEQPNRWNISPNVAPVYFNSLGKGSTISSQFVSNSKSGEVNMSYGISGSYALNDKIKIRTGVNKVALGYSTNGVMAFNDVNSYNTSSGSKEMRNINFKNQEQNAAYMSTSDINSKSAPQFMASSADGALEQQFGYIEVPLEVEYSIVDSKFGLNLIGGFSTLFLNDNEVYSVMPNQRSLLGEANNINSTSYSANFGLGLNYNISRSLKLNLEPMFKYQINTFNNTSGDFRPYFMGVYSGFSFKF